MSINHTTQENDFRLRLFRAQSDPKATCLYFESQREALADIGVEHTTSVEIDRTDPNVYLLCAETPEGGQLGGLCGYVHTPTNLLPIEKAIGEVEPGLRRKLGFVSKDGVAECCAGWTRRSFRGHGVYAMLLRTMVAAMPFLRLRYFVALGSEKSIRFYGRFGLVRDGSLGRNGQFLYPDERFISSVGWCDCDTLSAALDEERGAILRIREAIGSNLPETSFTLDSFEYCLELLRDFPYPLAMAA